MQKADMLKGRSRQKLWGLRDSYVELSRSNFWHATGESTSGQFMHEILQAQSA